METTVKVIVISEWEWKRLLDVQEALLRLVNELATKDGKVKKVVPYITAMEFMEAVRIGRTKFDQLVAQNMVKTIKRGRKIYVSIGEVERYFKEYFLS